MIMIVMLIVMQMISISNNIGMAHGMHSARGVRPVAERRTEIVLLASGKISTTQTGSRPTGVSTSEHRVSIYIPPGTVTYTLTYL